MSAPKILFHTDSAYFTTYMHRQLKKKEFDILGYWYNPQIHPYSEYRKRFLMHQFYSLLEDLPMVYLEGYPVEKYLTGYPANLGKPGICQYCFQHVLGKVADYAQSLNIEYFTSTWCADPAINQDLLREVGDQLAVKRGLKFYYQSFHKSDEVFSQSEEMKLYHQTWCGCLLSEYEVNSHRDHI